MLQHLIHKEILEHLLSLRFIILSALGGMVIWLSLFSGYEYYRDTLRDYRLAETLTESHIQYLNKTLDEGKASDVGHPVQKPPTAMSIFVRGLDPVLGRTGYVAFTHQRRLKFSAVAEEPLLGIFDSLDLTVAVEFVLSLFMLLLTYDAVCGEKETGTLGLIASFPVSKDRLLLSKAIGALLPTMASFGIPLFLGIAVLLLLPDVQFERLELLRLGIILAVLALYLVAFACAGILASCLTHRAATSFVILLVFWVGAVAVLPRLSLIVADRFRPAPSTQRFQAEMRALDRAHQKVKFDRYQAWREGYLRKTGKHGYQTPDGREAQALAFEQIRQENSEIVREAAKPLEEAFRNRYRARLGLAVLLARLSPAFALNSATARLAGTGTDRHQRFMDAFNQTRDLLGEWYRNTSMNTQLYRANPKKYADRKPDFSDLPRVNYRETWPDADLQTAMIDIGILAVWGVFLFLGAYVALLRYDFR